MKASDISMDGGYSTLTWITRFVNKWCFHLHQTLTVFVTLVSVKPLSAEQLSSPAICLVTAARLSLSVSPVLVTSAISGSTSQDRSGGGLPAIISQWNIFSLSRKGFYTPCSVHKNNCLTLCWECTCRQTISAKWIYFSQLRRRKNGNNCLYVL